MQFLDMNEKWLDLDHLLQHAIEKNISDVHIEPSMHQYRIRYRHDGILHEMITISIDVAVRFITQLKIMAKLDIAERRLPQDGRFHFHHIDIRLNTCPTLCGEKIVLRLLNSKNVSLDLSLLGFNEIQHKIFISHINRSNGMVLVTGPTGSGKTVTLYSAINYLNTPEKNISTVEDPVEIQLLGINQVNIQPKIGLEFSNILRTLLRQDPDILMVGEIRDNETAKVALQAAQTGHFVFSTLHTNNAIESILRLKSMDIPKHSMINAISLIIAQRLVRKLCAHCKQKETMIPTIPGIKKNTLIYRAQGCQFCVNGYSGRTGIYEFLVITDKISDLFLKNMDFNTIKNELLKQGYIPLIQSGKEKILSGITSIEEVNRVLGWMY